MKKALLTTGLVTLTLGTALVLTGFVGPGRGWGCAGGHHPERLGRFIDWRVDALLADLDATEAQRQQVHALKTRLLADVQGLMGDNRAAHAQFLAQWEAEQPDPARVHQLVDARLEAAGRMAHRAADAALELHRTLTPEQRRQLATELRERHGGH